MAIPQNGRPSTGKTAGARQGKARERPRAAHPYLLAALIVAATLLVYERVFRAGFIWDDDRFLTRNPLIHASDGLYRFWFTTQPPDYFPLTSSMLWLEWRLWGTDATGYHVVNVLLHAASALLLWRVLLRLRVPGAWLAGLLFAVHPVAVESVAWITERKNTLSMVFYMASILVWLRSEEVPPLPEIGNPPSPRLRGTSRKSAIGNYVLSLLLFLLALLAKSSVVMLPAVLLGCAWWRRGRVTGRDFLRVVPFAALAAALGLVTVWYQYHRNIGTDVVRIDGLASRAACAGWAAWFYLYKALLPVNFCFVYPRWATSASLLAFVPGLLFLAMLFLFAWFRRSPSAVSSGPNGWGRPFLFALGYFLVALLPVLGFLNIYFMKYSLVSDHWQYTALIGPVALAAGLLAWVMERHSEWRTVAMAVAGAVVLACAFLTFRLTPIYHDEITLWRDTLAKNPNAWMAYHNLGLAYARVGRAEEAMLNYNQAVALKPDNAPAYCDRGTLHAAAGRYAEAMRDFDHSIALKPDNAPAYCNRGNLYALANRYDEAIREYDRSIAAQADYEFAWYDRGLAYAKTGHPEEAMRDFDQAIALNPEDTQVYLNRGNLNEDVNHRYDKAIADYTKAIRINPGCVAAYISRAIAYYMAKDYQRARSDVRIAQRLGGRPDPAFLRALDRAAGPAAPPLFPAP
jgi:tetratricopeptide (TPR) repeat protein